MVILTSANWMITIRMQLMAIAYLVFSKTQMSITHLRLSGITFGGQPNIRRKTVLQDHQTGFGSLEIARCIDSIGSKIRTVMVEEGIVMPVSIRREQVMATIATKGIHFVLSLTTTCTRMEHRMVTSLMPL